MTKSLNKCQAVSVIRKLLAAGVLSKVRQSPVERDWGLEGEPLEAARLLHAHPEWLQWLSRATVARPVGDIRKCRRRWRRLLEAAADFELAMWQAANRRGLRGDIELELLYYKWHDEEQLEERIWRLRELIDILHLWDRLSRREESSPSSATPGA